MPRLCYKSFSFRSQEYQFHKIYRKLFPALLRLATDVEQVTGLLRSFSSAHAKNPLSCAHVHGLRSAVARRRDEKCFSAPLQKPRFSKAGMSRVICQTSGRQNEEGEQTRRRSEANLDNGRNGSTLRARQRFLGTQSIIGGIDETVSQGISGNLQVTQKLFSEFVKQIIRWFTSSKTREHPETMALLDAILEGLVDEDNGALRWAKLHGAVCTGPLVSGLLAPRLHVNSDGIDGTLRRWERWHTKRLRSNKWHHDTGFLYS